MGIMGSLLRPHERPPSLGAAARRRRFCSRRVSLWGLTGALAESGSPSPAAGKVVLHVGIASSKFDNLNPFIGYATPSYEVWHLNYDMLYGYSAKDLAPVPELAAEMPQVSPDGKTVTVKLRSGCEMAGRRALHGQGRGLHLQLHHRQQPGLRERLHAAHQERRGGRRHDGGLPPEQAEGQLRAHVGRHPARAHLEQGVAQGGREHLSPTSRPSSARGPSRPCVPRATCRPSSWTPTRTTGAVARRSTRSSSTSTRTPTTWSPTCAPASSTSPTVCRRRRCPASSPTRTWRRSHTSTRTFNYLGMNCYAKPTSLGNPVLRDRGSGRRSTGPSTSSASSRRRRWGSPCPGDTVVVGAKYGTSTTTTPCRTTRSSRSTSRRRRRPSTRPATPTPTATASATTRASRSSCACGRATSRTSARRPGGC